VRGTEIKLWHAAVVEGDGEPGTVIAIDPAGIVVAAGAGALRREALQRAGGKRLPAGEFLRGFPLAVGERFAPTTTGNT
jgi:methionyl-tRNA formyltransferase